MLTITNIQRANVACSSKINKSRMSNRVVNNVPFGPQRLNQMTQRYRQSPICAAAQAETGKLISKVEIPPFIPRSDLMDQLMRWAIINVQEDGVANLGSACKVSHLPKAPPHTNTVFLLLLLLLGYPLFNLIIYSHHL
jgi:hypothetical protein